MKKCDNMLCPYREVDSGFKLICPSASACKVGNSPDKCKTYKKFNKKRLKRSRK